MAPRRVPAGLRGGIVFAVGAILMTAGMGRLWPIMIILSCLAVTGTARWEVADPIGRAAYRTVHGVAALGAVPGGLFLVERLSAVDLPLVERVRRPRRRDLGRPRRVAAARPHRLAPGVRRRRRPPARACGRGAGPAW